MKHLIVAVLVVLFMVTSVFAEDNYMKLEIDEHRNSVSGTYNVTVYADAAPSYEILAAQIFLDYDESVLEVKSIVEIPPYRCQFPYHNNQTGIIERIMGMESTAKPETGKHAIMGVNFLTKEGYDPDLAGTYIKWHFKDTVQNKLVGVKRMSVTVDPLTLVDLEGNEQAAE